LTRQVPFRGCHYGNDGRIVFHFQHTDDVQDLLDDYYADFAAPGKSLLQNYKFLLAQLKPMKEAARRKDGGQ
jgi:hypothetical protein